MRLNLLVLEGILLPDELLVCDLRLAALLRDIKLSASYDRLRVLGTYSGAEVPDKQPGQASGYRQPLIQRVALELYDVERLTKTHAHWQQEADYCARYAFCHLCSLWERYPGYG